MARVPLHPDFTSAPLAHRGYHDAAKQRPENSLSAFGAAVKAGYGIELDVQLSAEDRKSTRLNSSHVSQSRMPSSA